MSPTSRRLLRRTGVAAAIAMACGCNILDVESPGKLADDDLNARSALGPLVVGMSYDLAQASNGVNDFIALAGGELWHGGSYDWSDIPRGIILAEDVNGEWGTLMQAQWVTDHGVERIRTILPPDEFAESELAAQALIYGGYAHRLVGENVCEAIVDVSAPMDHTIEFELARDMFTEGIAIAQAVGLDTLALAGYAGRASVNAWLGDWPSADADAAQVPVDFEYFAILNTESNSNTIAYETHDRFEYTVHGTEFANHFGDPRAPWDTIFNDDNSVARGANGATPHFQQQKYDEVGDDIRLSSGTEMLVLRAENALRNNDIPGAMSFLDQARAQYGLGPLTQPSTLDAAWAELHYERGATTWLENRRLWDARRWFAESGPAHFDFLNGRDQCIPISQEERLANPNIPAGTP